MKNIKEINKENYAGNVPGCLKVLARRLNIVEDLTMERSFESKVGTGSEWNVLRAFSGTTYAGVETFFSMRSCIFSDFDRDLRHFEMFGFSSFFII